LIVEALEGLLGSEKTPLTINPVEPATKTDAGKVVRELRDSRF
jgi:hypothetical protein